MTYATAFLGVAVNAQANDVHMIEFSASLYCRTSPMMRAGLRTTPGRTMAWNPQSTLLLWYADPGHLVPNILSMSNMR